MSLKEIELKYNAASISPETFKSFCEDKKLAPLLLVSGYDHFYSSEAKENEFFRYRVREGESELTFKRKLTQEDNIIRVEYNLKLINPERSTIESFCKDMGFMYDTSIFKTALIYEFPTFTLSYYICYDMNMVEWGRFIEIELSERFTWPTDAVAKEALELIEKKCQPMGISPLSRIKESLFEMCRSKK